MNHCFAFSLANRRILSACSVFGALLLLVAKLHAVSVLPVFDNGMVLQRNEPIVIFGSGNVGEKITVTLEKDSATTQVGPDKKWKVTLPPRASGKDLTLRLC